MPRTEKISFEGAQNAPISAILDWPDAAPRTFAIFAHCFTCSKDIKAAYWTSRCLARGGIAVLRFDFSGLGQSEGDFARSSFSSNIEDLLRAAAHLRQHHHAPSLLVGHSLGGTAVLASGGKIPEVKAVVTIAAPLDPGHLRRHVQPSGDSGEVELLVAGRRYRLGRQFIDDLSRHDMQGSIAELSRALLVAHSPADSVVSIAQAREIFQAAKHPKSFLSLDGADHILSRREDAEYAGQVILAWSSAYLPSPS